MLFYSIYHALRLLFIHKKRNYSETVVDYKGHLRILLPEYSKRQLRTLCKAEHKLKNDCASTAIEFIPFETFFTEVLHEASNLPFLEQLDLWTYYHKMFIKVSKGNYDELSLSRKGIFYAAINVTLILSFADTGVIINRTSKSEDFLSIEICENALDLANLCGKRIMIIDCMPPSCFSIRNDKSMHMEEVNSIDHHANVYF